MEEFVSITHKSPINGISKIYCVQDSPKLSMSSLFKAIKTALVETLAVLSLRVSDHFGTLCIKGLNTKLFWLIFAAKSGKKTKFGILETFFYNVPPKWLKNLRKFIKVDRYLSCLKSPCFEDRLFLRHGTKSRS